jgi:hypothetical protein
MRAERLPDDPPGFNEISAFCGCDKNTGAGDICESRARCGERSLHVLDRLRRLARVITSGRDCSVVVQGARTGKEHHRRISRDRRSVRVLRDVRQGG